MVWIWVLCCCALIPDQVPSQPPSQRIYATGDGSNNEFGQGRPLSYTSYSDLHIETTAMKNEDPITRIVAGRYHTIFQTLSGKVFGTGNNDAGQLGLGYSSDSHSTPILVPPLIMGSGIGHRIVKMEAGTDFNVFLNEDSVLYSFGSHDNGQCGVGPTTDSPVLKPTVVARGIVAFAVGTSHTLMIGLSGNVYSFGSNSHGQLGVNDLIHRSSPTLIDTLVSLRVVGVFAGADSSFCKEEGSAGGRMWAWGNNRNNQLGLTSETDAHTMIGVPMPSPRIKPVVTVKPSSEGMVVVPSIVADLEGKEVRELSIGVGFSLLLTANGNLYGSGDNSLGQLGLTDSVDRKRFSLLVPAQGHAVVSICSGANYTLALTAHSSVLCWGSQQCHPHRAAPSPADNSQPDGGSEEESHPVFIPNLLSALSGEGGLYTAVSTMLSSVLPTSFSALQEQEKEGGGEMSWEVQNQQYSNREFSALGPPGMGQSFAAEEEEQQQQQQSSLANFTVPDAMKQAVDGVRTLDPTNINISSLNKSITGVVSEHLTPLIPKAQPPRPAYSPKPVAKQQCNVCGDGPVDTSGRMNTIKKLAPVQGIQLEGNSIACSAFHNFIWSGASQQQPRLSPRPLPLPSLNSTAAQNIGIPMEAGWTKPQSQQESVLRPI